MDVDLESVEIMFAQRLTSGEPLVRARAFKALQDWIKTQSEKKPFGDSDMIRLWKGLHYTMWMQDKMLMQEELADKIAALLHSFRTEDEKVLYVKFNFISLGKEWKAIDRWRMDKFLMLVRRVVRATFTHLSSLKWKKSIRDKYVDAFKATVINADKTMPDGLKFHFASLLLDELDLAGGLNKKQVTAMIEPYVHLLSERKITKYLFDSVIEEIFATILMQFSQLLLEAMEKEEDVDMDDKPACMKMDEKLKHMDGIKFDYETIRQLLFDVGKQESCIAERRARLYAMSKKFELAAAGKDPFEEKEYVVSDPLTEEKVEEAAVRLLKMDEERRLIKEEYKKKKKVANAADMASKVTPEITRDNTGSKIRKEMKKHAKEIYKKKKLQKMAGGVKKKSPSGKKARIGTIPPKSDVITTLGKKSGKGKAKGKGRK